MSIAILTVPANCFKLNGIAKKMRFSIDSTLWTIDSKVKPEMQTTGIFRSSPFTALITSVPPAFGMTISVISRSKRALLSISSAASTVPRFDDFILFASKRAPNKQTGSSSSTSRTVPPPVTSTSWPSPSAVSSQSSSASAASWRK